MDGSPDRNQPLVVFAVDDEPDIVTSYRRGLSSAKVEVRGFVSALEALDCIRGEIESIDCVLVDVDMPEMSGLDLLAKIRDIDPGLPVIMVTGDARAPTAVSAMIGGAANYLVKPILDYRALASVLRGAAKNRALQRRIDALEATLSASQRFSELIGDSDAMDEVRETILRIAPQNIPVLVQGESGTGKELAAQAIHRASRRASGPFVAINCAALPPTLIDTELFGHTKGAFTGAVEGHAGAFERANGGTLFLDEIGDIEPAVQVRLLRVLQEREVLRVGGSQAVSIDVRVIAASLVDLDQAVEDGSFRADLLYRLDVVKLVMPPLRHRAGDIALLAGYFLRKHARELDRDPPTLTSDALQTLVDYRWPGNVRQLENALRSALAMEPGDRIAKDRLPSKVLSGDPHDGVTGTVGDDLSWASALGLTEARQEVVERFERAYVKQRLLEHDGVVSAAARASKMERSNFRRVVRRLGIDPVDYKDS